MAFLTKLIQSKLVVKCYHISQTKIWQDKFHHLFITDEHKRTHQSSLFILMLFSRVGRTMGKIQKKSFNFAIRIGKMFK